MFGLITLGGNPIEDVPDINTRPEPAGVRPNCTDNLNIRRSHRISTQPARKQQKKVALRFLSKKGMWTREPGSVLVKTFGVRAGSVGVSSTEL